MPERDPRKTLERLGGDDLLGGATGAGLARPRDEPEDAVELWAKRVGRGLAIAASIALVAWFVAELAVQGGAK